MNDLNLPPRLDAAFDTLYTEPKPDPAFAARLEADLRRHQEQLVSAPTPNRPRRTFMQTLRAKPVFAILLVLLALALLTGVAYAVGRLSGFIPGFGFVSDASTARGLEAPVQVGQNGMVFRVERAADDGTRFWVETTISQSPYPETAYAAVIELPDGQTVNAAQAGWHEEGSGNVPCLFEFPAMPPKDETFTLRLSYAHMRQEDWTSVSIPFKLRALRRNELIPAQPSDTATQRSATQGGLTLVLDNVAPASNKTILQVSVQFDRPQTWLNSDWSVTLSDADGRMYPLTKIVRDVSDGNTKTYETVPFASDEDLTLSLYVFPDPHNLPLMIDLSTSAPSFTFDPGTNPQIGQTWQLDKVLQAGGYTVHLTGAKLVSPTEISFEFEPVGNVTGVMLYSDKASGASAAPPQPKYFTANMSFKSIPTTPFEIKLSQLYYTVHGAWQIRWHAPAAPAGVVIESTAAPDPTAWVYATPTLDPSNSLAMKVRALAQKFAAPFQQGPGWIHWQSESTHRQSAGRGYPPAYITNEQWIEIDGDGYVVRSLYTDRDKDGSILQQSATIGNYSVNFTTGDADFNNGGRYRFSSDTLTQSLADAAQANSRITQQESTCEDGSACLVITILTSYPQPMTLSQDEPPLYGSGQRFWINLATGQQVKWENILIQENKSEVVKDTYQTVLLEKVAAPPQDVFTILDRVTVPK